MSVLDDLREQLEAEREWGSRQAEFCAEMAWHLDRVRDALMHYAELVHWHEIEPGSFKYTGESEPPWKTAREALDGEVTVAPPAWHEYFADAGPHDFVPLGRWLNRHKCRHCFYTENEHPMTRWVPARPYGDKR